MTPDIDIPQQVRDTVTGRQIIKRVDAIVCAWMDTVIKAEVERLLEPYRAQVCKDVARVMGAGMDK